MNGKMPHVKEQQFYSEDYKTRDKQTLMHEYKRHLERNERVLAKKAKDTANLKRKTWTEADQLFEDMLWAS